MKVIHQSHQVNFFTNNDDVLATPMVLSALLTNLSSFNLMPTFGQEINPITGEAKQIVIMIEPSQTFRVEFPHNAIIISGLYNNHDEFILKAGRILKSLQSLFPEKRGNRLSSSNTRIYTGNDLDYNSLYKKLFTYHKEIPFEWDNRIAHRKFLANSKEEINSISTIRRCEIQSPFIANGMIKDSIIFEVDSNTIPKNDKYRFSLDECVDILKELHENNKIINEELNRYTRV